ncbi:MAG: lipopolysaccharide assembly protein LapA domain-containing protein [Legionella sp.]
MRIIMILLSVVLIFVGISFSALNASLVTINFYFTTISVSLALLVVSSLIIGLFLGYTLFSIKYLRLKAKHYMIKNQLKIIEKELKKKTVISEKI